MSAWTPKPIQVETVLADPAFPDWGKDFVRAIVDKDVVDVCNVLEFLTGIWTVKVHEACGIPQEPALNPIAYQQVVEALRAIAAWLDGVRNERDRARFEQRWNDLQDEAAELRVSALDALTLTEAQDNGPHFS